MTIWDTIQEIDFDHEDFENHFSAKQKEGGEGDNDKLNAALAGKVRVRLFNSALGRDILSRAVF